MLRCHRTAGNVPPKKGERMRRKSLALLAVFACLGMTGCVHTRDVSDSPEYQPWIGKTVNLNYPGATEFRVFDPLLRGKFVHTFSGYNGYPISARLPMGYPAVIKAVERKEGNLYPVFSMSPVFHMKEDKLLLIFREPSNPSKRFTAWCELDFVEQFQDKSDMQEPSDSRP
jgi:hypothetical protein